MYLNNDSYFSKFVILFKCLFLFFFLFRINLEAKQLNLKFEHLTIEDGLPHSKINTIYQDHQGYIWFGTNDGLARYNGYEFKVYQHDPEDTSSISHNLIRDIFEDQWNNLWIATDVGGLNLFKPGKDNFIHYKADPDDPHSISSNNLFKIIESRQGHMWITSREGLNYFNQETGKFYPYYIDLRNDDGDFENGNSVICRDSKNEIWLVRENGGIVRFNIKSEEFTGYNSRTEPRYEPDNSNITGIYEDETGNIWIGTDRGLYIFDRSKHKFREFRGPNGKPIVTVRTFHKDKQGHLWLGSRMGLYIYDTETKEITIHKPGTEGFYSLSHKSVQCIFKDKKGDIWIGTREGVNFYNKNAAAFRNFSYYPNDPHFLNSSVVFSIYEDEKNDLWIGTESGGINLYDRDKGVFRYYMHDPNDPTSISTNNIKIIKKGSKGHFWIGTYDGGLNRFNPATGIFKHYKHRRTDPHSISNNDVYSIEEAQNGDLWLATHKGVNVMRNKRDHFVHYYHEKEDSTSLSHNDCNVVYKDRNGIMWVGTFQGLNRFDKEQKEFVRYYHAPQDSTSLSSNCVECLYDDSKGRFWVGTLGGGLNLMNRKTGEFKSYLEEDGLANNSIYGILEDSRNNLWLSTNKGISKFNPEKEKFNNYNSDDGLLSSQFNYNAYHKNDDGKLFFGGIAGVNSFYPEDIRDNEYIPPVVFTDFKIFNQSMQVGSENSLLKKPINITDSLQLSHKQSVITFEFAALNYVNSSNNRYAYKLEGFNTDWHYIGTKRSITFTNLDPGEYTLRIRGSNNRGKWNKRGTSLAIIITPPFYETLLFRIFMGLCLIAGIFLIIRARLRGITKRNIALEKINQKLNNEIEQRQKAEAEKKEIERQLQRTQKLETIGTLAGGIAHDFNNILTPIIGHTEILKYSSEIEESLKGNLEEIYKAALRAKELIAQILNFSRKASLEKKPVYLPTLVEEAIKLLRPSIPSTIEIKEAIDKSCDKILADPSKIHQVIVNLCTNAYQAMGEKRGVLMISLEQLYLDKESSKKYVDIGEGEFIKLSIKDTGIGMNEATMDRIFDPFFTKKKGGQGTGLGLSVVHGIVKNHNGTITVDSEESKGTTFNVYLPAYQGEEHQEEEKVQKQTELGSGQESILIIDDKKSVTLVTKSILEHLDYHVTAYNSSLQALQHFKQNSDAYDLIITDLTMPDLTGVELIQEVRKENNLVPIIIMTGYGNKIDNDTARKLDIAKIINKPIIISEISEVLREILE